MQNDYFGTSLRTTIRRAVYRDEAVQSKLDRWNTEKKFAVFSAWAGPLIWGPWTQVWVQFGVVGANRNEHVSYVDISFHSISELPSSFDVEIRGGDRFIRSIGPGSELVTVTGEVATAISVRFRSHSIAQDVKVFVN